jgi:hypothetical protein
MEGLDDSSVWIMATGWAVKRSRFDSRQESGACLVSTATGRVSDPTHSHAQRVPGAFLTGIKRPERYADLTTESSAACS